MTMTLPKIVTPEWTTTLPLTNVEVRYRPYLVKEEKILLTAMESFTGDNVAVIGDAVKQIIKNCIITAINVDDVPNVDVEWLFIQMRKHSVGETIDLKIEHKAGGCGHINKVTVRLDDVKYVCPEGHERSIKLTETAGIVMRYPDLGKAMKIAERKDATAAVFDLIIDSIDKVWDGDDFESASKFSREELKNWVETFNSEQFRQMTKFFETMPSLRTEIKYTCEKCGVEETMEVKGAGDFFI